MSIFSKLAIRTAVATVIPFIGPFIAFADWIKTPSANVSDSPLSESIRKNRLWKTRALLLISTIPIIFFALLIFTTVFSFPGGAWVALLSIYVGGAILRGSVEAIAQRDLAKLHDQPYAPEPVAETALFGRAFTDREFDTWCKKQLKSDKHSTNRNIAEFGKQLKLDKHAIKRTIAEFFLLGAAISAGFAIFGASFHAVPGEFLMTGLFANPLGPIVLAALGVAIFTQFVVRFVRTSTSSSSAAQGFEAALKLEKLLDDLDEQYVQSLLVERQAQAKKTPPKKKKWLGNWRTPSKSPMRYEYPDTEEHELASLVQRRGSLLLAADQRTLAPPSAIRLPEEQEKKDEPFWVVELEEEKGESLLIPESEKENSGDEVYSLPFESTPQKRNLNRRGSVRYVPETPRGAMLRLLGIGDEYSNEELFLYDKQSCLSRWTSTLERMVNEETSLSTLFTYLQTIYLTLGHDLRSDHRLIHPKKILSDDHAWVDNNVDTQHPEGWPLSEETKRNERSFLSRDLIYDVDILRKLCEAKSIGHKRALLQSHRACITRIITVAANRFEASDRERISQPMAVDPDYRPSFEETEEEHIKRRRKKRENDIEQQDAKAIARKRSSRKKNSEFTTHHHYNRNWLISISLVFLAASATLFFLIFTGQLTSFWYAPLAALFALISLSAGREVLRHTSGGPYGEWGAIIGAAGFVVFWLGGLNWGFSIGLLDGFGSIPLLSPLAGVLPSLLVGSFLLVIAGFLIRTADRYTQQTHEARIEERKSVGYGVAKYTLITFKLLAVIGLLFLLFVNIAMLFNLTNIGVVSNLLDFTGNVVASAFPGGGGGVLGARWLTVFSIIFSAASVFGSALLINNLFQKTPSNVEDLKETKSWARIKVGLWQLLKVIFTLGPIFFLGVLPTFLPGASMHLFWAFGIVAAFVPLFSGNAKLGYIYWQDEDKRVFFNEQRMMSADPKDRKKIRDLSEPVFFAKFTFFWNTYLGVVPLRGKSLKWVFAREFLVLNIVFTLPVLIFVVGLGGGDPALAIFIVGALVNTAVRAYRGYTNYEVQLKKLSPQAVKTYKDDSDRNDHALWKKQTKKHYERLLDKQVTRLIKATVREINQKIIALRSAIDQRGLEKQIAQLVKLKQLLSPRTREEKIYFSEMRKAAIRCVADGVLALDGGVDAEHAHEIVKIRIKPEDEKAWTRLDLKKDMLHRGNAKAGVSVQHYIRGLSLKHFLRLVTTEDPASRKVEATVVLKEYETELVALRQAVDAYDMFKRQPHYERLLDAKVQQLVSAVMVRLDLLSLGTLKSGVDQRNIAAQIVSLRALSNLFDKEGFDQMIKATVHYVMSEIFALGKPVDDEDVEVMMLDSEMGGTEIVDRANRAKILIDSRGVAVWTRLSPAAGEGQLMLTGEEYAGGKLLEEYIQTLSLKHFLMLATTIDPVNNDVHVPAALSQYKAQLVELRDAIEKCGDGVVSRPVITIMQTPRKTEPVVEIEEVEEERKFEVSPRIPVSASSGADYGDGGYPGTPPNSAHQRRADERDRTSNSERRRASSKKKKNFSPLKTPQEVKKRAIEREEARRKQAREMGGEREEFSSDEKFDGGERRILLDEFQRETPSPRNAQEELRASSAAARQRGLWAATQRGLFGSDSSDEEGRSLDGGIILPSRLEFW